GRPYRPSSKGGQSGRQARRHPHHSGCRLFHQRSCELEHFQQNVKRFCVGNTLNSDFARTSEASSGREWNQSTFAGASSPCTGSKEIQVNAAQRFHGTSLLDQRNLIRPGLEFDFPRGRRGGGLLQRAPNFRFHYVECCSSVTDQCHWRRVNQGEEAAKAEA